MYSTYVLYVCTYWPSGAVYYADSSLYRESYNVGTPILNMVFSPERHFLIIVTSSMDLCQVAVNQKGETTEMLKVGNGNSSTV